MLQHMLRRNSSEFQLHPEIERLFRALRRQDNSGLISFGRAMLNQTVIGMANDRYRPMRDYAIFDPHTMQTSIVRPALATTHFEFKPMMFQMLQSIGQFGGGPIEDPHLHLKQFVEVCSNFILPGVTDDAFKLKLFPYSLKDRARAWLNSLEPNSIISWNEMAEKFMTKYFPPIKNARMRTEITAFKQTEFETLFEAWERYKELLRKCPHNGLPVVVQMEIFYSGLEPQTRLMLDASSGGVLLNGSYHDAYDRIEVIAANCYQWPTARSSVQKKAAGMHDVSEVIALTVQIASLTHQIKKLDEANAATTPAAATEEKTEVVAAIVEQATKGSTICVYCGGGHTYEECPGNPISVNFAGYNKDDNPYSSTYNATSATENSMEALLKAFISETKTQEQTQGAAIKNLENQIGQIAKALTQRLSESLPSTTEVSLSKGKETACAISLRSGKDLIGPSIGTTDGAKRKEKIQKNSVSDAAAIPSPTFVQAYPDPPFPQRLKKAQQNKQFGKFMDVLKQLHINVPLVEALQQMPNYAQFMKDVLTKRRRLGEFETVAMSKECSMIMQSRLPSKLKDPGRFTIPCSIGESYTGRALCDLGASINLMPKSIFDQLSIGLARPTTVTLQLADRSIAYPEGIIEDVLIKVDKFVFPADFVILDFVADKEVPIILGRPFMATGKTLIDVQKGELTMRVNDQEIKFNVMNSLKVPKKGTVECSFIVIDPVINPMWSLGHWSNRMVTSWHA